MMTRSWGLAASIAACCFISSLNEAKSAPIVLPDLDANVALFGVCGYLYRNTSNLVSCAPIFTSERATPATLIALAPYVYMISNGYDVRASFRQRDGSIQQSPPNPDKLKFRVAYVGSSDPITADEALMAFKQSNKGGYPDIPLPPNAIIPNAPIPFDPSNPALRPLMELIAATCQGMPGPAENPRCIQLLEAECESGGGIENSAACVQFRQVIRSQNQVRVFGELGEVQSAARLGIDRPLYIAAGSGDAFGFHATDGGPNFMSVMLPDTAVDSFLVDIFDGSPPLLLEPGTTLTLGLAGVGVPAFMLLNDPLDVVIGLTFAGLDPSDIGPLTEMIGYFASDSPTADVFEPNGLGFLVIAMAGLAALRRQRRSSRSSCGAWPGDVRPPWGTVLLRDAPRSTGPRRG